MVNYVFEHNMPMCTCVVDGSFLSIVVIANHLNDVTITCHF